jgi:hypothetical protein
LSHPLRRVQRMFDVVDLGEKGRKIAGANVSAASDDELFEAAAALAEHQSLVSVGLARVVAELDARGSADAEFGLTTASWLAREAALPGGVARQSVRLGAKLCTVLPVISDAVVEGRITAHHAKVVADACRPNCITPAGSSTQSGRCIPRVVDAIVGLQDELVAMAQGCTFEQWRGEVRALVELLDDDGAHDPNAELARNRLSVADTIDGITYVRGELVGEHALAVKQAIDAKADELFRQYRADHEVCADVVVPERATLRALALAELCRAGGAVDVNSTRPPRPEVTLVVPAEAPDESTEGVGVRLQDGTNRVLRCDPDLFALVVDSLGVPLDMGRHVRLATAAQRRALAARDGGCVFPGCTLPPQWCDAHHLDPGRTAARRTSTAWHRCAAATTG